MLIQDSLDSQVLEQLNITVVSDDIVDTYSCGRHGTSFLRGIGRIVLTGP